MHSCHDAVQNMEQPYKPLRELNMEQVAKNIVKELTSTNH